MNNKNLKEWQKFGGKLFEAIRKGREDYHKKAELEETRKKERAAAAREEQARAAAATRAAPRNERPRSNNPIPAVPNESSPQLPPEGETPPLCWCGDTCKFMKSKERISLGMRYWGCANYASDYPDRRFDTATYRQPSPEPLCGFRKWIDLEIHPADQWTLDFDEWNVTREKELMEEERRNNEHTLRIQRETQAHLEACTRREREARERERERKRELAAKAKEAAEDFNAERVRKGKWPRSTQ